MHVQLLRRVVVIGLILFVTSGARAATPNERYVNLAFSDLLARTPTPVELTGYTTGLDNATLTRTQFASSLLGSGEFCDDKTISFFSLLLHRNAAPLDRASFASLLQSGSTFEHVEGIMAGSAEYFANRGGSTNDGFLDAAFSDFLGRPLQPSERSGYDGALGSGTTREQVSDSILGSSEYRADMIGRNYLTLLRRNPVSSETNNLVGSGLDDRSVVKLIIASQEYYNLAQTIPEPASAAASGLILLLCAGLQRRPGKRLEANHLLARRIFERRR